MENNIVADILSKGCTSIKEAVTVKQIFQELSEVRRYWDVEYFLHIAHQKIYLKAKIKKTQKPSLFIPNHISDGRSFQQMTDLLALNAEGEFLGVYLVFINSDSTSVFYQITEGLIEPKKITSKNLVRSEKKHNESVIKKYRELIEQSALYGVPITLKNLADKNPSSSKDNE